MDMVLLIQGNLNLLTVKIGLITIDPRAWQRSAPIYGSHGI